MGLLRLFISASLRKLFTFSPFWKFAAPVTFRDFLTGPYRIGQRRIPKYGVNHSLRIMNTHLRSVWGLLHL